MPDELLRDTFRSHMDERHLSGLASVEHRLAREHRIECCDCRASFRARGMDWIARWAWLHECRVDG